MTSEEKARILPKMFTITEPQRLTKKSLPISVVNITHLPVVTSQGNLGSCAAYATCYYMKTFQEAKENKWIRPNPSKNPERIASPAWGYNVAPRSLSFGALAVSHYVVADYICEYGIASWEEMPYNPDPNNYDWEAWPTQEVWKRGLKWRGKQAGEIKIHSPEGLEALKEYLAEENVAVITTPVYSNFDLYPSGEFTNNGVLYGNTNVGFRGPHAITVIGYDDDKEYYDSIEGKYKKGALLAVNSWGTEWGVEEPSAGTRGFVWLAYDYILSKQNGDPNALIIIDRIDYKPNLFGIIGINHTRGRTLFMNICAGYKEHLDWPVQNPLWKKEAFPVSNQYSLNDTIVIDLTDFAHYEGLGWHLEVFQMSSFGGEGEINYFAIQKGDDILYISPDTPKASVNNWFIYMKTGAFTDINDLFGGVKIDLGAISWADFNNDGLPDLLISGGDRRDVGSIFEVGEPSTLIFINNGDGTFQDGITGGLPQLSQSILAVADYNNDGYPDVAIHGTIKETKERITRVYHNNGDNTFTLLNITLPTVDVNALTWADIDNDGKVDLVISTGTQTSGDTGETLIYKNYGDGRFEVVFQPINASGTLAWADIDNDGWVDFAVSGRNKTAIYKNMKDGIFREVYIDFPKFSQSSLLFGDYNNDGFLDLIITGKREEAVSTPYTVIYKNNRGDGTFVPIEADLDPLFWGSVAMGDINNDGLPDLVITGRTRDVYEELPLTVNRADIYINIGDGSFQNTCAEFEKVSIASDSSLISYNNLALVDYDKDGDLDIFLNGTRTVVYPSKPEDIYTGIQKSLIFDNGVGVANTPPTPPTELNSSPGYTEGAITLSWGEGNDIETPSDGLYYNLRVGSSPGGIDIVSPVNRLITPGGVPLQSRTSILTGLSSGTYYWAVQTIDAGKEVSDWSNEGSFTIAPYTQTYNLYITLSQPEEYGTTDPLPGIHIYNSGSQCVVEAIPYGGYKFSHWSGDVPTPSQNPLTLTTDRVRVISPHFKTFYDISPEWTSLFTPTWSRKTEHSTVVFEGKLWVLGGRYSSTLNNEVRYSEDGIIWHIATSSAPWSKRYSHSALVFNDRIWIIGGLGSSGQILNDIWSSDNGFNWTLEVEDTPWTRRSYFSSAVFGGKMWIIGGWNNKNTFYNDIWSSSDGVNWTQEVSSAQWSAREGHASVVFNNKLWVIGGNQGVSQSVSDVWYSSDGIFWEEATSQAGWSPRRNHSVVEMDGKLWLLGGRVDNNGWGYLTEPTNEIWYSLDGSVWGCCETSPNWGPLFGHTSTFFKEKLWLLSEDTNIWYTTNPDFPDTFTLGLSAGEGGTTLPSPGYYYDVLNKEFHLKAVASYGYKFKNWEGEVDSPESETTTLTLNKNKTVKANFEKIERFTLTVTSPVGLGTTYPTPQAYTYPEGEIVELKAIPSHRHTFLHWEGDVFDASSPSTKILMDDDKTITAHFIPDPFALPVNIDGGDNHTVFLQEGNVWVWGDNTTGQLGNGTLILSDKPFAYSVLSSIKEVSAGSNHTVALQANGSVWSWGSNEFGQLGINSNILYKEVPTLISGLSKIIEISTGGHHTIALKSDGTLWSFGLDDSYQLGLGLTNSALPRTSPAQVLSSTGSGYLSDIKGISAGYAHNLALKQDGTLWSWGDNTFGQLGTGNRTYSSLPLKVAGSTEIKGISAGGLGLMGSHSLAVDSNGNVWSWGANNKGQLGNGANEDGLIPEKVRGEDGVGYLQNIRQVSAGGRHSLALDKDGNIWAWGDNTYGQLGDGTNNDTNVSVRVAGGEKFVQISTGTRHSIAIDTDGQVWVWGFNLKGQLGNGNRVNSNIPVLLEGIKLNLTPYLLNISSNPSNGGSTTPSGTKKCIPNTTVDIRALAGERYKFIGWSGEVTSDETSISVYMDGYKSVEALFELKPEIKATLTMRCNPPNAGVLMPSEGEHEFEVGSLVNISVLPGYRYTFTGWSDNVSNPSANETNIQLNEDTVIVANFVKDDFKAVPQISAGRTHNLTLKDDSGVMASGRNEWGELGINNEKVTDRGNAIVTSVEGSNELYLKGIIKISAGYGHSLTLSYDGTICSWGLNSSGEIGDGTTTNRFRPVKVKSPDGTGELSGIIEISAGVSHSVAVKMDGTLWAWGDNTYGQLGINLTERKTLPVQVRGVMNNGFLSGVVGASAGENHTLALLNNGTVYSWGRNSHGQLGNGSSGEGNDRYTPVKVTGLTDVIKVEAGKNLSMALKSDGTLWVWGDGSRGQLGNGLSGSDLFASLPQQVLGLTNIKDISSKDYHVLALKNDGTVWSWGDNWWGQLGDGTSNNSSAIPVQVKDPEGRGFLSDIISISTNYGYSMALKSDGTVWFWGWNYGYLFGKDNSNISALLPYQYPDCDLDTSVEVIYLTMALLPKNAGNIFPPEGIHAYNPGTEVNVRVEANPDYLFSRWSEGTTPYATYNTILMDSTKNVTAYFEKPFTDIGDINKDGIVDIQDVILALRMSIELPLNIGFSTQSYPYLSDTKKAGDMNIDGRVDISDVILILRFALRLDIPPTDPYQPKQVVSGATTSESVSKDIQAETEGVADLKDGTKVKIPLQNKGYNLTLSRVSNHINLNEDLSLNAQDDSSPQISGSLRVLEILFDSVLTDTEKLQLIPTITIPKKEVGTLNLDTVNILRVTERVVEGKVEKEYSLLPAHLDNSGNLTTKDIYLPTQLLKEEALPANRKSGIPPISITYSVLTFQGTINWQRECRLIRTVPDIESEEKRKLFIHLTEEEKEWELKKPIKNVVVLVHGHNEAEKTGLAGQFKLNAPIPWGVDYKVDVWKELYEVFIKEYFDFNSCTVFYEFIYPTWRPIFNHLDNELVKSITEELQTQLNLNREEKDAIPFNLFIVAHSMGGVVSRAGIVKFPEELEERFQQFISWGSPHKGAAMYSLRYQLTSPAYKAKTLTGSIVSSAMAAYVSRTVIDAPGILDLRWENGTGSSKRHLKLDDYFDIKEEYRAQDNIYNLRTGSLIYNKRLEQLNTSDNRGGKYTFMYGITEQGVPLKEIDDMGVGELKDTLQSGEISIGATINRFLVDKGSSTYLGFMESDSDGAVPITSMTGLGLNPSQSYSLGKGVDHESYYRSDSTITAEKTFELLGFKTNPLYDPPEITFTNLVEDQLPIPDINGKITIEGKLDWKSPRNLTKGVKDIKLYKYTYEHDISNGFNWEGQEVPDILQEDWSIDEDGTFAVMCSISEPRKVYAIKTSIIFKDDTEIQEIYMLGSPEENETIASGETVNWSLTGLGKTFGIGESRTGVFHFVNYIYEEPKEGEMPAVNLAVKISPSLKGESKNYLIESQKRNASGSVILEADNVTIDWEKGEQEPADLSLMEVELSTIYENKNEFSVVYILANYIEDEFSRSSELQKVVYISLTPYVMRTREELLPPYHRPPPD